LQDTKCYSYNYKAFRKIVLLEEIAKDTTKMQNISNATIKTTKIEI